jgi:aminopeptidase N
MADERDEMDATEEEKRPINNVEKPESPPVEPQVQVRRPPKNGCLMSRGQAFGLALFVFLLVLIVGACAAILTRTHWCPCDTTPNYGWWNSSLMGPKPTVASGYPWSGIRLNRDLIPSYYSLELRIDLSKFQFSGSVDIDVKCQVSTQYVILHNNGLRVNRSSVYVQEARSGKNIKIYRHIPVPINQFWVLHMNEYLEKGKYYRIRFGDFQGKLEDDLRGLYRSSYKDQDGNLRYLAASQLQSVDARKVFPCFDEPDLKANFSVNLIHRPELVALSNMPQIKSVSIDDGWTRTEFRPTPIMSTYLLAFVVAEFRERKRVVGNLTIRIWAQPDMYDQTKYSLKFAQEAYAFFAKYFGTPEVVPKADHVAIPDFSAGAMENWGLVLYRETTLLHDEDVSSISNKYWVSLVIAHEIAHTWFGNMVTMKWWDDLWLNEGFANTLMYFALNDINPKWSVFDLQLVNNLFPVMTKDSLLTSHAISTPIRDPDDIPQFFDSISYDKGMAVLRLLRGFLGWDDFQRGLQNYINKYKFKNARMSELWKTFQEAVNGRFNVGQVMDTWTRQMGFPVVTVKHLRGNTYRLDQKRFLLNPNDKYDPQKSAFRYKCRIPFTYKLQGDRSVRTEWMNLKSADITVPEGSWIMGNVDYMGFFRTNYDEDMWRKLIDQLHTDHEVFSASNRAGLINDAFNLARANQLSYDIALNLTSYLHKETDYVPWRAFLDSIDFIKGMVATSNSYGLLKRYISNLVAPQYRRVGISDMGDLLERNLRRSLLEAAAGVNVPDAIDWAKRTFNAWKDYGTRIPPDYSVVVYSVGVQEGGEKAWDHLWEKSKTTRVASEAEIMMNALAYTQEPWLLWRYARWSLDSSKIRMQDVRNLFRYFASTPLGRSVALQFLLTNWREINIRFGMDAFLLRDIIYATTSLINTEYEYKQLERLYRESPPAGVARKAADNSLALIRSNTNWMKTNNDAIRTWLEANVPDEEEQGNTRSRGF